MSDDALFLYFGTEGECQMCGGFAPPICPGCGAKAVLLDGGFFETEHDLTCPWMRNPASEAYPAPKFCDDCVPEARRLGWLNSPGK